MGNTSIYDGSTWRKAKNIWMVDSSNTTWRQAKELWIYDGTTWRSGYKREVQTWATISISDTGSWQGTSSTGGNWTQEPTNMVQGAWTTTGWYGGIMLMGKPTIGNGVVSVDDYQLQVTRQTGGSYSTSNTIRWRGVNSTSLSGTTKPTWTSSGADMGITGNTGTKSTESGGLTKVSSFKDLLKSWLGGSSSYANLGIYAGENKPNQSAYLKISNISLKILYTYIPN